MTRDSRPARLALSWLISFAVAGGSVAQEKDAKPKPAADDTKAILADLTEAFKAPYEVDKAVLDELRQQYRDPTAAREAKIFAEIQRLYPTTPGQTDAILRELRRAYTLQTAEQESRLFDQIHRNGTLPLGTLPLHLQAERARKLFDRNDANKDGALDAAEVSDALYEEWRQWDRNRDGLIHFEEFGAYYQDLLSRTAGKVASGEVVLKLPKGMELPPPNSWPADPQPVLVARNGKLPVGIPDWFTKLDADRDSQISLFEWRSASRPLTDFQAMDLNGDGLIPPDEYVRYATFVRPAVRLPVPAAVAGGAVTKGSGK